MTKTVIASMQAKIKKHEVQVASVRDKIRETLDELESLHEACELAVESLQNATDALSELA